MIVVADSSPLITLARVRCFDLLPRIYGRIVIPAEFHFEVTVSGAGMPGAIQTARADWIDVSPPQDPDILRAARAATRLGSGELSAVFVAKELSADLVLIDEWRARRYARQQGLVVMGCVGILEDLYERGELKDLREIYRGLIQEKARIDAATPGYSLSKFGLDPL